MKVSEALQTLAKAVGLRANCQCKENEMDLIERATELHNNEALTAKQLQMLQEMDDDQKAMVRALMDAMPGKEPEAAGDYTESADDDEPMPAVNKGKEKSPDAPKPEAPNVDELVANKVAEHLRRHDVTQKLVANERCPFSADEMKAMNVDHLEKLEKSIRPADYSGQGGPSVHSSAPAASPLRLNRGLLSQKETK